MAALMVLWRWLVARVERILVSTQQATSACATCLAVYKATKTIFEGLKTPVYFPVKFRVPVPRSTPNEVILWLFEWQT
jgi:hypothetical protein